MLSYNNIDNLLMLCYAEEVKTVVLGEIKKLPSLLLKQFLTSEWMSCWEGNWTRNWVRSNLMQNPAL